MAVLRTAATLTASGNEITDATRWNPTQGDGRPGAATITLANAGFEVDTASWTTYGAITLTRSTTAFLEGVASGRLVTTGTGENGVLTTALAATNVGLVPFTFNIWVRASSPGIVRPQIICYNAASVAVLNSVGTRNVRAGVWEQLSISVTAPDTTASVSVGVKQAGVGTVYLDAVTLGVTGTPRFDVGENLFANPSFEEDVVGAYALTGIETVTRSTAEAYDGIYSAVVTTTAASGQQGAYFSSQIPASGGESFVASLWFKGVAGQSYITAVTQQAGTVRAAEVTFTATGAWQYIERVAVSASGDTGLNTIVKRTTRAGVETFYVDGVQLERGSVRGKALYTNTTSVASHASSYGIYPAATNLVPNSHAKTNLNFWTNTGTLAMTRVTSPAKFGTAVRLEWAATNDNAAIANAAAFTYNVDEAANGIPVSASTVYTCRVWHRIDTAFTQNTQIYVPYFIEWTAANAVAASHGPTVPVNAVTSGWVERTYTFTTTATTARVSIRIGTGAVITTGTLYIGGVQLEAGNLATPLVATDGATATRAAATITVNPANMVTVNQGWWAAAVRVGFPSTSPDVARVVQWRDAAARRISLYWDGSSGRWAVESEGGTVLAPALTFIRGDVVRISGDWTATAIGAAANGSRATAARGAYGVIDASTLLEIGHWSVVGSQHLRGDVLWLAMGTGTLTNADAATLNAVGNRDPHPGDLPASAGLTGIWRADGLTIFGPGAGSERVTFDVGIAPTHPHILSVEAAGR